MATRKTFNSDERTAEERALDAFASLVIGHIEQVKGDWHKPWFSPDAMLPPRNMQGRKYNASNALLLMMLCQKEGYKVPVFGTFNAITGLNHIRQSDGTTKPAVDSNGEKLPTVTINKGSRSFPVQITTYTVVDRETKEKIPYDDYLMLSDEDKKQYNVYPKQNVFQVFNVCDQTNIKDARPELYKKFVESATVHRPKPATGERYTFPPLDAMIKHNGWVCPINEVDGDSCYYSISQDAITMVRRENFESGESFVSNCFHEMAHSLGPEDRLGRFNNSGTEKKRDYATEECVAELTAAFVSARYGLEKHVKEDSAPYLKSWLDNLKESPEFIRTLLGDVRRASAVMTKHIDAIQERIDKGLDNPIPEKPIFEKKPEQPDEQKPKELSEQIAAKIASKQEQTEETQSRGWHR